jgi:hypothetical protein
MILDCVSFLAYPNLFGIEGFVVVLVFLEQSADKYVPENLVRQVLCQNW